MTPVPETPWVQSDADIFIFDDDYNGYYAAKQAADTLGLSYDFSSSTSSVRAAAVSGAYKTIVVNSQSNALSFSGADVFSRLADFANGGGNLIFQAWELDLCGGFFPCSAASRDAVIAATGGKGPVVTYFDAPNVATASAGVCPSFLLPHPFLPLGQGGIGKGANSYGRDAQAVTVDSGTQCFETKGKASEAQVIQKGGSMYVGFLPGDWKGKNSDRVPGDDVVAFYTDALGHVL